MTEEELIKDFFTASGSPLQVSDLGGVPREALVSHRHLESCRSSNSARRIGPDVETLRQLKRRYPQPGGAVGLACVPMRAYPGIVAARLRSGWPSLPGLALWALVPTTAASAHSSRFVFRVDTTADVHDANPGDGLCRTSFGTCTLRAALEEADAFPAGSAITVDVPAGTYDLTLGSLTATANDVTIVVRAEQSRW